MVIFQNLLVLPDGTEIGSDKIKSLKVTGSVNSEEDMNFGSVCSSMLEVTLYSPGGSMSIPIDTEIEAYRVDAAGARRKIGVFTAEKPTRQSANTYRIIAYDHVARLDKDLSVWLSSLDGWPYTMGTFAKMVCKECLVELEDAGFPNDWYLIEKFSSNEITGRKIMGWIGELAGRFCNATSDGVIRFSTYRSSGFTFYPYDVDGFDYYFSLKAEDYQVQPIDVVQVRLADSEDGMLWPAAPDIANSYVIANNPLISSITSALTPVLNNLKAEISNMIYTPCRVVIPASTAVNPGNIINVVDQNGNTITTYVMTKTSKGQRDTLECTGNPRRNSSTAVNNTSAKDYADSVAGNLTQKQIFNKLTKNGTLQGLFIGEDGQIYVNASYIKSGGLDAALISAGILQSKDGETFVLDLDKGTFSMSGTGKFMSPDGKSYISIDGNDFILYSKNGDSEEFIDIARIGFTEDSSGADFPYVLLGHAEGEDKDKLGLVKMFSNGIYVGNSAPRKSTGSFSGLIGAAGLFIDTINGRTYNVMDETMYDSFSAVFA